MNGGTCDCVCYACLTPNRVFIGTAFYSAFAWFKCYKCKESNVLLVKTRLAEEAFDNNVQEGKPVE